ncbi:hypothetical protein [Burkholderia ambifaria]|uniref:CS1 type fimbrial major subunit n=1 Tax=Burkholderia ambifaria MEX-5 TaxID=396597 RepID=B1T3W8_9BURK|nr:hypothetical protein [Burkholderia ambifaria]EDT41730.1 conserved hypothetical protein [Burkholderia ambifaria MEX-5]
MKIHLQLAALAACGALTGSADAGPTSPQAVVKTIKLTAHIGDSLFVSKPDDSAWNDVVELTAMDSTQQNFGATLPIRVRTTSPDIHVVLLPPPGSLNGAEGPADTKVALTGNAGNPDMVSSAGRTITLVKRGRDAFDGFDETHDLQVSAPAPVVRATAAPAGAREPRNLVLVFEPAASAGREPADGTVPATGK